MKTIRQGDVALVLVSKLPSEAKDITPDKGRVVLAYGEVTGHAHAVYERESVRLWQAGAERFLQVLVKTALKHEEHSTAYLDPGIYQLPTQVEYHPEDLRNVAD